jgi:ribosomal protein S18 acetylase RimI-like enzyme
MDLIERLQAYFATNAAAQGHPGAPEVEGLPDADPHTTDSLVAARLIGRSLIMACTPDMFVPAPPLPGVTFILLSEQSPLAAVRDNLDTNGRGFDPDAAPATEDEALAFRATLTTSRACTALCDGAPAAAGMFTSPVQGITELTGITTLSAYRQRGIGTALTGELTRSAFAHRVDTVILRTANPIAIRAYQRVGFRPVAYALEPAS